MGYLIGNANISITSTSLNIDKTLRIEDFSPFSIEELGDYSAKYFPLKSISTLKIPYNATADHLADASLKFMDFDFDLNDELVFRKPCGMRWGLDFLAFEIFGYEKETTGFYYNGESEFNLVKNQCQFGIQVEHVLALKKSTKPLQKTSNYRS